MNVLVIVPHADDEVFGCGGTIARHAGDGDRVELVVGAVSDVHQFDHLKSSESARLSELERSCEVLGVAEFEVLSHTHENRLDVLPRLDLIGPIDDRLRATDFERVFIPTPSHHQDHRVMHEVALAALRPGGPSRFVPKLIAAWSYTYTGWEPSDAPVGGHLYVDISEVLDVKLDAARCYESQLADSPHAITLEAIETMAKMRGIEAGCAAAERHHVLRTVI